MTNLNYNSIDAARLLLNAYLKVLKVNLTNDTFDEVKVDDVELDDGHGYSNKISKWFSGFALTGNIHPDDTIKYLKFTKIENLINEFTSGKEKISLIYRRKIQNEFKYSKMTLIKSNDYSKENKIVLLYIEDINDDIVVTKELSVQKNITASLVDMYFTCLYVDLLDNSYKKVYVNKEYEDFVPNKGNMKDVVEAYMNNLIVPNDITNFLSNFSTDLIKDKLKAKNSYDYEYWAKTKNGKIWVRIVAILVDKDDFESPRHILIAMQDVTNQAESIARTNEILKDAINQASAASTAKSEFMSRMSHDIRTPLNAIIGMTAIAGAHLDNRDKTVDCLSKINGASKHLLSIINDILDLSKIESGKVILSEVDFNLSDLMSDLLEIIQSSILEHHHELKVYTNNIKHENVIGDNVRLQQIFLNLVSNAILYTPDYGEIKITLEEYPSSSNKLGLFKFIVEDNGYGMSEEFQKKVFEPFERENNEHISTTQGSGLGLSIVKNLVDMMGGNIKVESSLGSGSKISIEFKIKLQFEENKTYNELLNLPVLVVDDDIAICESTCLMLDELGVNSEYVKSGYEAISRVIDRHNYKNDYYAILIDWKMPGINGIETTKEIRKIVGSDITIIIISAYEWNDIEKEAREAGVDGFISKPLFKSNLYNTLKSVPKTLKMNDSLETLDKISNLDCTNKRFLLVEDNKLNREIAKEILSMTNATIITAENGYEALKLYESNPEFYFDIIFLDIQMPIMDGYETSKNIRLLDRKDSKKTQIVALTANAFIEDIEKTKEVGMNAFISKPIDIDKLSKTIYDLIK